jgi:superfamily II DNA or RNA helicase
VIACGQDFPQHIAVPRGCLTEVLALLHAHKIRPEVRDERFAGTPFAAEFDGQLRSFQEEPVAGIGGYDEGILCAPTAFGKTTVAAWLGGAAKHIFVLKGGMGKKQRRQIAEAMAAVPDDESRVILATGSYIGEGLDDARLDTLFLAMPISCKGALQQYVGRLHRLHDNKRVVQVYDYVDNGVPMLARMYERRLKGYSAIGYAIEPTIPRPTLL